MQPLIFSIFEKDTFLVYQISVDHPARSESLDDFTNFLSQINFLSQKIVPAITVSHKAVEHNQAKNRASSANVFKRQIDA